MKQNLRPNSRLHPTWEEIHFSCRLTLDTGLVKKTKFKNKTAAESEYELKAIPRGKTDLGLQQGTSEVHLQIGGGGD